MWWVIRFLLLLLRQLLSLVEICYGFLQQLFMSDNFRVSECLHTPSSIFTIHDYTKLAYIAGGYVCVREVVSSESRPLFLPLESAHSARPFAILSFPNCVVLAEQSASRDIVLHFYQQDEQHLRVASQLAKRSEPETALRLEMKGSTRNVYLIVSRENDVEIIVVDFPSKSVTGRAFLTGEYIHFRMKPVENQEVFSLLSPETEQIIEYEVVQPKQDEASVRIIEKSRWSSLSQGSLYCWAKDELIVYHEDRVVAFLEGRETQTIPTLKNASSIEGTISGFLLLGGQNLTFFKKSGNAYEVRAEYFLGEEPSSSILLSPQEDLLAFYSRKHEAIYYSSNFENPEGLSRRTRVELHAIQHEHHKIKTYSSPHSLMLTTSEHTIRVYSPITYCCYLYLRIEAQGKMESSQKRLMRSSTLGVKAEEGQLIETAGVHPNNNVIAVAFRNSIKIYQILYNEVRVVKEILVSFCREVGFNRSGSLMFARVGGKQGSKIYLYSAINNYEFMEVLSANKPIEAVRFSPLDNLIYAVHHRGFYTWNADSLFKHRTDYAGEIAFEVVGAQFYASTLVLWGEQDVLSIPTVGTPESIRLSKQISNLIIQKDYVVVSTPAGELYRCKGVTQINNALMGQSFPTFPHSRLYSIKHSTLLSLSREGNILCIECGPEDNTSHEVVSIERKRIQKYQERYKHYEEEVQDLEERLTVQLDQLKEEFALREEAQRVRFTEELQDREDRYLSIRAEKLKLEETMEESMQVKEQETLHQVKDLEKMYERKIAITTNKLLTAEELGFRNQMLAKENLHFLEGKHFEDIQKIRSEYGRDLSRHLDQSQLKGELFSLKKEYETRLSELEQENENLLKRFQNMTEGNIINLKKNIVNLELKYSEEVSQKVNLQKEFEDKLIELEVLRAKNEYLEGRLGQEVRRGQLLAREHQRVERLVVQKDQSIACLERRVEELEKSNQIFKYRIIEMKNVSDPKEEEILKLKDNMIELEEEYEKITKRAHEYEQSIALLKKDIALARSQLGNSQQRERKLDKSYSAVVDKVREATKAPIQEIRKLLIKLLEQFDHSAGEERRQLDERRSGSPLGELNRVREHLEVCLMEVVQTGKKNQKHKNVQISRKNRENSELLREINDLRVRVRELEALIKEKDLELQENRREGKPGSAFKVGRGYDRVSTNFDSESREMVKNRTKESFFEKSLFKGHWREKRLRTEQGSRKKSAHSLMKQETNQLYIESKGEEVEELRRLLDQKETIIKQLINKIHKLS